MFFIVQKSKAKFYGDSNIALYVIDVKIIIFFISKLYFETKNTFIKCCLSL